MSNSILPDVDKKRSERPSRAGDPYAAAYNKKYAEDNADRLRAYRKATYPARKELNRERYAKMAKESRERNKEAISARRKAAMAADPGKRARNIERAKAWYVANKEAVCKKMTDLYKADPENVKKRVAEYQKARPEQTKADARVRANRRRARMATAGGEQYTRHDIAALMELQRGKCANCLASIRKKYHIDHKVPVAKGGTNEKGNIELLCPKCNYAKGAKLPHVFAQENGRLL